MRLENFKAWRDTGTIELAPLTIFFGSNSSGKSSLNHFLMLLRQTARSADRTRVFDFGDATGPVSLGSFRDVVFRHDTSRRISFSLQWDLPTPLRIRDPKSLRRYSGDSLRFSASARQAGERDRTVQHEGFSYNLVDRASGELTLAAGLSRDENRHDRWRLDTEQYETVRSRGRPWELPKPVRFYGFPPEAQLYFQNTAFLSDLELMVGEQLSSISYLGPLRSTPERLYSWSGSAPGDVGWQGEAAIQALVAASDRRLNFQAGYATKSFQEVVASWLQELGLLASFRVEPIAPDRDDYEVKVKVAPTSEEVRLTDVGFGISQVLPVVVQCFYATPNSTILVEQPEIHLHPAVQSALADLFLAAIRAREASKPRGVQIVIESHSEHLLRRLLRRVAEEQVAPEDVALYFCQAGADGSTVERLDVDIFGEVRNWPPDFFGDELEDVTIQTSLGLRRRLAARAQSANDTPG